MLFRSLEANTGKELKEPWVISAPFGSSESLSVYTDARKEQNTAPVMPAVSEAVISDVVDIEDKLQKVISFTSASDDDFVHSYKISFKDADKNIIEFEEVDYNGEPVLYDENGNQVSDNGNKKMITELLYFSDFVLGLDNMSETTSLRLPVSYPQNAEYAEITAIDSWGAESKSVLCKLK